MSLAMPQNCLCASLAIFAIMPSCWSITRSPPVGATATCHTLPGTPCAQCGRHPETSSHLFLECCVSAAAVHSILIHSVNRAQVEVLTVATLADFELRSSLSSDDCVTLLSFSCAVWKAREQWLRRKPPDRHHLCYPTPLCDRCTGQRPPPRPAPGIPWSAFRTPLPILARL